MTAIKHDQTDTPAVLLTIRQVQQKCGFSAASIYRCMKEGSFPRQIRIGTGASRWLESDIEAYIAQRVAERDADQDAA